MASKISIYMLWSVILLNTGSCWPLKIFSLIQIKAASICLPHQKKRSPYCLSRGVILRPFLQPLCGSLAQSLWAYCRDIRPGWHKSSRRQQFLLTQHRAEMDGAAWVCRTHPQSRTEKSLGFLAAERRCFFFRHCNILLKLYSRDVIPLNHVSKHLWR